MLALTGCGAKTNEDIAKQLITEKLKTTLPDFSKYTSLNFGTMGSAALPYEETAEYTLNKTALALCKDSIAVVEKLIAAKNHSGAVYTDSLQHLQVRAAAKNESNKTARQAYTPEKLFTLTHAYTITDKDGQDKKTEDKFYIDKDFTRVVKFFKVY